MAIPTINVSSLIGSNGFRIDGAASGILSSSSAGDINGDGFDDVIIGAPGSVLNGAESGSSYLLFGKSTVFDAVLDLSRLDGNNGFRLDGERGDNSGTSVSSAGDINGDGLDDVIVGGFGPENIYYNSWGTSYVIYGKTAGFDATLNLIDLDGNNGSRLKGERPYDLSGISVSDAGDFNGDGFDDVIIGAPGASGGYSYHYGASYLVFGKASGFAELSDLSDLDGNNGLRLDGSIGSRTGTSVSKAGDINGDGFDDVIIGAPTKSSPNGLSSGSNYVVFGKASGFDDTLDLTSLTGSDGFRMDGIANHTGDGSSVSAAGDVNGDGIDDVIISMPKTNLNGFNSGSAYIIFGKTSQFASTMDLLDLDGHNGFRVDGLEFDNLKSSGAGDVNGDGYDDLIISTHNSHDYSTTCYVLFGKPSGFNAAVNLLNLTGLNGFEIKGLAENHSFYSFPASGAGDLNGDGFDDLIIGASGDSSPSYVVFGSDSFNPALILGTAAEDNLEGSPLAERFEAGLGSDRLIGSGGADIFHAGEGDDTIIVPDLGFQSIEGDKGNDTLELVGANTHLKLADYLDTIKGVETFNLSGNACILMLSLGDLHMLSDSATTFTINGDSDDYVSGLNEGWEDKGIDGNYHLYANQGTILRVETTVSTDRSPAATFSLLSLNGLNGFRFDGVGSNSSTPMAVDSAGDVNGDGFDDVIIGFPDAEEGVLNSVVFGKASSFDKSLHPSNLDGSNGFRLEGKGDDRFGFSVSGGGDVNGDGFDDVIVGAPYGRIFQDHTSRGLSYVIFGKASGFDATISMASLNGSNGFSLIGTESYDLSGSSVSIAGDVNGDGLDDLIIGAPVDSRAVRVSSSYVVFGQNSGFGAEINLSDLNGNNGFRLKGIAIEDDSGRSVSNAGDMNGDGFSDLIIGSSDSSYIVFGKASGFAATMDLSSLDGQNGFRLNELNENDNLGISLSSAGDINGDGFDDVIIGASGATMNGLYSGSSYVIFGKASGFAATMDLSSLDGQNGFRLDGVASDASGTSVSGAGDVNGDGFDELLIGAPSVGTKANNSGASYIVFGKASGFLATQKLSDLDGINGFRVDGLVAYDGLGAVSNAGDVNGDGFDDLIMSAAGADPNGINSGSSYVIFGSRDFGKMGLPEIQGTPGDDNLIGTPAAEIFKAGDGSDIMIGRGGADVFHGDAGDDDIKVADLSFALIDGGTGDDVLHLAGSDLNLDLASVGDKINGIETICLYGKGDNTLTLSAQDVLNLSGTTNTLKVNGNAGDHIVGLSSGWVDGGSRGAGYYHVYTQDDAVLLVGMNLTTDFA